MTPSRAGFFVVFVALAAYANSLGNGFAYDDDGIITQNPVVQSGDWRSAVTGSWWPESQDGAGLYRPLTLVSFVGEWNLFRQSPVGPHALNIVFHAMVSFLLFLLILDLGSLPGALAGGVAFAVHPIHTEAVANVVGRAELYAALFYLLACILYWRGRSWEGPPRFLRLVGLGALYGLALAGKEIAVTLPGALFLLEALAPQLGRGGGGEGRGRGRTDPTEGLSFPARLWREGATFLLLAVVLASYLVARYFALGAVVGELPAPLFLTIGSEARVLTAFALWVQYARLLLFPLRLAADYDPGVMFPSETLDLAVVLGATVLVVWLLLAFRTRDRLPLVSLGLFWFCVTILPVSNLLFPTGVLLAERTLYIPSMALSFGVAGVVGYLADHRYRKFLLAAGLVAAAALLIRTVTRNPSWMSSYMVQETLNEDFPQSWRAIRARAQGLERVGALDEAREAWDLAVRLAPMNYTLLVQAGDFHCRQGLWSRCESYLREAIRIAPGFRNAYQLLSGAMIRREFGREGHRIALEGLTRSRNDQELWALVSESYILKGDLQAAARAREAAISCDPEEPYQWDRLADILEASGDETGAAHARARAHALDTEAPEPPGGVRR